MTGACARAPRLGIIGGGQLAKMLAQAAYQFGCEVVVLERDRHSPAATLATRTVVGDWDAPASLLELAALVDVVTLENEFVAAESLAALERAGHALLPSAACVRTVQDKLWQKEALRRAGLPVPAFADAPRPAAALAFARQHGWPVVLKKRRHGYDGKGNATVGSEAELDAAWHRLGNGAPGLYVEAFLRFEKELAAIITRARDGSEATYPVVETIQRDHVCQVVRAPAAVATTVAARAGAVADRAVEAVGGVGTFGVEMFLGAGDEVFVNELAPRVHNSGHYTIEACECSQFENHVRAVLGWPLGATRMRAPAAAMVNLLGVGEGTGEPRGLAAAQAVEGAHIHIYGKTRSARGRKMGHVTALGATLAEALATAERAAAQLRFGEAS